MFRRIAARQKIKLCSCWHRNKSYSFGISSQKVITGGTCHQNHDRNEGQRDDCFYWPWRHVLFGGACCSSLEFTNHIVCEYKKDKSWLFITITFFDYVLNEHRENFNVTRPYPLILLMDGFFRRLFEQNFIWSVSFVCIHSIRNAAKLKCPTRGCSILLREHYHHRAKYRRVSWPFWEPSAGTDLSLCPVPTRLLGARYKKPCR